MVTLGNKRRSWLSVGSPRSRPCASSYVGGGLRKSISKRVGKVSEEWKEAAKAH